MSTMECWACKNNEIRGGDCPSIMFSNSHNCLRFVKDERGRWKEETGEILFYMGLEIPKLNTWENDYEIVDNHSPVRFSFIQPVRWDMKNGGVICLCQFMYFPEMNDGEKEKSFSSKVINIQDLIKRKKEK